MAPRNPRTMRALAAALALLAAPALAGCRWHHPGHDSDYPSRGDHGHDHDHGHGDGYGGH